jgi:hypothetical protein
MSAPPESLVVCSICRLAVAPPAFEEHLRQVHQLYTFRGVRRSLPDTLDALLEALLAARPSQDAWQALVGLARDMHGAQADDFLAGLLAAGLARAPEARRASLIETLAPVIAPGQAELITALAQQADLSARLLALACLACVPWGPALAGPLRIALLDRQLPPEEQVRTLAVLWKGLGDDTLAEDLVGKLTAGLGKAASLRQLRRLAKRTGRHPAITTRLETLQAKARLVCSRCGVELHRPRMEQHLWHEHRLILDGLRTRDPWNLIEEWLDACKAPGALAATRAELLARCQVVAAKIDPDGGPARLTRLALARGLADPAARAALLDEAREEHAACCPFCGALVPVPREVPPLFVNLRPGRLSAGGYEVELDERGLKPRLVVRTPTEIVHDGLPPERSWTYYGASILVSAPLVVIAVLFAVLWPDRLGSPIRGVLALLALAGAAFVVVRLLAAVHLPSSTPVLELAWRFLVPRLHAGGFQPADSAFLAGLARLHARVGLAGIDLEVLRPLMKLTEQAMSKAAIPAGHLAALCRLWIEEEVAQGADPVPLVAAQVARTFEGKLPLAFAQHLLAEWATEWWAAANLARLRILLCDAAFEAGFEVQGLLDAGENAPALGAVLRTGHPRALAALRLLWSQRPTRPWDRLGEVQTAFELAHDPANAAVLADRLDLLLWWQDPQCMLVADNGRARLGPATVRLTTAGVWLQDILFPIPPRVVEVRLRSAGSHLILGNELFRSPVDLDPLSRRMERWFRFAFHEFLPQIDNVLKWQSPDRSALLRAWGAVPCPECSHHLLPRVGEIGIALSEQG